MNRVRFIHFRDNGELRVMPNKKTGSETSAKMATLASKAMRKPSTLTTKQIKQLGGAVLGQREPPTVPLKPRGKKR